MLLRSITFVTALILGLISLLKLHSVGLSQTGNFNPIIPTAISHESLHSVNSPSVVDAYSYIFGQDVYHLSQQEGSQLMPFVQMLGMTQAGQQIPRVGTTGLPSPYLARGSRVTASNPSTDVRWVSAQRYWLACHVDSWDQYRTNWNIQQAYTVEMANSFGRMYDWKTIAAALGTVYTGPNRSTAVALPISQKYLAGAGSTGAGAGVLDFEDLINIRTKMKKDFAISKDGVLILVVTADEMAQFLREQKISSRDFTNTLVLARGQVSAYMGMLFVETELLPQITNPSGSYDAKRLGASSGTAYPAGTYNRCFAFVAGKSLCFGINMNMMSRISERDDIHYVTQIYFAAEFGAVRKEEVTVLEIYSKA